jgi:uncharacterized membrane protein
VPARRSAGTRRITDTTVVEGYILDWLSLIGRWVHFVTGVAWIGASLYFVWLDNHLLPPTQSADADRGVGGELWAVHGGGFYHAQKYKVAPPALPTHLHWFKWEAYWTWMSGIFLMVLIYWYGAEIYLIDPHVADLSKPAAIALGVATLIVGWVVYDLLCKSPLGNNQTTLSSVLFVLVSLAAWGLCELFSGRGAYIHFGAMLGTIMVGNVFFVIIPGQKDLVAAKQEKRDPDPAHGERAKQRSVHNTYFTLPVLFVMVSNHYALTYGHEYNWLILIAVTLAGAAVRVWFVNRHFGKATPVPLIIAVVLLLAVAVAIAPSPRSAPAQASAADTFAQVRTIVAQRCTGCHAAEPTQPGFAAAPKGVAFDTVEEIVAQAAQIHQQTVVTKAMPIGNLTKITDAERALLDAWFSGGAKVD